jgi:hypothetical protein
MAAAHAVRGAVQLVCCGSVCSGSVESSPLNATKNAAPESSHTSALPDSSLGGSENLQQGLEALIYMASRLASCEDLALRQEAEQHHTLLLLQTLYTTASVSIMWFTSSVAPQSGCSFPVALSVCQAARFLLPCQSVRLLVSCCPVSLSGCSFPVALSVFSCTCLGTNMSEYQPGDHTHAIDMPCRLPRCFLLSALLPACRLCLTSPAS